jgi:hypothetical protein
MGTDISEEYVSAIFGIEEKAKLQTSLKQVASIWRRHVPPKNWFNLCGLQGVIFQKMKFFITIGGRTSNLAFFNDNLYGCERHRTRLSRDNSLELCSVRMISARTPVIMTEEFRGFS